MPRLCMGTNPLPQSLVAASRVVHACCVSTRSRTSRQTGAKAADGRPLSELLALPALESLDQGTALDFISCERMGPDLRIVARVQGRDSF